MEKIKLFILIIGLAGILQACQKVNPQDYSKDKAIKAAQIELKKYCQQEHVNCQEFKGPYLLDGTLDTADSSITTYDVYYFSPTQYFFYDHFTENDGIVSKKDEDPSESTIQELERMDPYTHQWSTLKNL